MPFLEHLKELRKRLWWSVVVLAVCFGLAYWQYDRYITLLTSPLLLGSEKLQMLDLMEGFTARMRIALYAAIVMSMPVHLMNIAAFVLPALTDRERRFALWTLSAGTLLALGGALFAYNFILPISIPMLTGTAFVPEDAEFNLTFAKNVDLVIRLLVGFALLFQFPLVLLLLMALEVVQRKTLLNSSRYMIVLIFILSAIATPPDPASQIGLALPLILLFYLSIVVAKIFKFGESYS